MFTTSITSAERIDGQSDWDPMQNYIGQEVFIIHGSKKAYRGTLHSLSREKCIVAILQGQKWEFRRDEVVRSLK
jgi:hypothetical protein